MTDQNKDLKGHMSCSVRKIISSTELQDCSPRKQSTDLLQRLTKIMGILSQVQLELLCKCIVKSIGCVDVHGKESALQTFFHKDT